MLQITVYSSEGWGMTRNIVLGQMWSIDGTARYTSAWRTEKDIDAYHSEKNICNVDITPSILSLLQTLGCHNVYSHVSHQMIYCIRFPMMKTNVPPTGGLYGQKQHPANSWEEFENNSQNHSNTDSPLEQSITDFFLLPGSHCTPPYNCIQVFLSSPTSSQIPRTEVQYQALLKVKDSVGVGLFHKIMHSPIMHFISSI